MTIRTKLAVGVNVVLMAAMAALGWSVIAVQGSYKREDLARAASVIENSVRRVALDTLLQRDDLQLVSYVNFLKGQYPALTYARFHWQTGQRSHDVDIGDLTRAGVVREKPLQVSDPTDPTHLVQVRLGIDEAAIEREVDASQQRLERIILEVWALASLAGLLLSFLLARGWTRPLARLGAMAETIGRGQLGGRLEWNSHDEIGVLVGAFNGMSTRLEELEDAKKQFVSSVSHELRSPLGAIASFIHLVEEQLRSSLDPKAPQSLSYLERVEGNIRRLESFISDILDAAKIERGKLECVLKPVGLQDVAADVAGFFGPRAAEQGVTLSSAMPPDLPRIDGDAERLRQVFVNLVSNSLKFTPKGGRIWISAEQFREGGRRWVEVAVRDNGRGMESQDLDRLFKLFSQGRNVSERVVGSKGTGLGLYICRSIIKQHGGQMGVTSTPGKGTAVSFTLRLAEAPPAAA